VAYIKKLIAILFGKKPQTVRVKQQREKSGTSSSLITASNNLILDRRVNSRFVKCKHLVFNHISLANGHKKQQIHFKIQRDEVYEGNVVKMFFLECLSVPHHPQDQGFSASLSHEYEVKFVPRDGASCIKLRVYIT
jgi:hypothetical protein